MSARPLVDPPTMPTMVSRLPKFGSRPRSVTLSGSAQTGPVAASHLTNGFYHHPGPVEVNGCLTAPPAAAKQNGFIRVPTSFSMKWRKEKETMEEGEETRPANLHQIYSQRQPGSPAASQRDAKKTTSSGKGCGFGLPVTSSSSSPQSSPRPLPVSRNGSQGSSSTKQNLNSFPGSKPCSGPGGSLRPPQGFVRPAGRSGSPLQKKSPASRCHSSDSLDSPSVHLSESDRLRSRSLTQVRRQPSPSLGPSSTSSVTRSYSINRRGASSAQTPPRNSSAKPSQTPEGGGRGGGVKGQSPAAAGRSGVSTPSFLPPSALKKPLLSSLGPAPKPGGVSYGLSRPSLIKQPHPLRAIPVNERTGEQEVGRARRNSVETPSTTEHSPESPPEAPERKGVSAEPVSQGQVLMLVETLEDMSLSSTSSLDRNDTSQEYMDDFDNLGNGGLGVLLLSKNDEDDSGLDQSCARFDADEATVDGVAKATGLCFLDDGMDWPGARLCGERGEHRLAQRRRSSQQEDQEQGGSSLDLSPSDSCGSGGTYMWDEEGLEPLGGAATTSINTSNGNTTHHIGSFDSDLNSIDVLNNLDSCDLDDDDLMLDAELPEDASLRSDGDGMAHMAQWRMRQLCWGTPDVHNDNESPGLGLDVEHLAEDCSAVRSQLEVLQRLLLQEGDMDEDTLTTDTLSPENKDSSHSSDQQVQDLLQEVQRLREELRSRDRTIAQLSLQLTVPTVTTRCRCQETTGRKDRHTQTSVTERESVASQTPWRERTPQIFHPSSQEDQDPLTPQAPPPADPGSAPPRSILNSDATDHLTEGGKGARKEEEGDTKERRKVRTLQPPQRSKLHLFTPQTSRPAAAKTRASRASSQLLLHQEGGTTSGVKANMVAVSSVSSRLPKPKSY